MSLLRTKLLIGAGWFLFWVQMVLVAIQDYLRDEGTALWQPVLWETSSIVAASILLLIQHRTSLRYQHLLANRCAGPASVPAVGAAAPG